MMMMKIETLLKTEFYGSVLVVFALVALFESDVLPAGWLLDGKEADFLWATLMQLLTIGGIPLAFALIRPGGGRGGYARRAVLRLSLLALPLVANTLLYYAFLNVAFGYLGIILFLSILFVRPTRQRFEKESAYFTSQDKSTER